MPTQVDIQICMPLLTTPVRDQRATAARQTTSGFGNGRMPRVRIILSLNIPPIPISVRLQTPHKEQMGNLYDLIAARKPSQEIDYVPALRISLAQDAPWSAGPMGMRGWRGSGGLADHQPRELGCARVADENQSGERCALKVICFNGGFHGAPLENEF
ncbi:predicted protein [Histoplasma capsulatum G186AR]|uniref:Uncharacterized protein n=1 Tax=Ajellomyces capsulatus (strain G186AR / H82 / ATCC MYA-2454 / RMSCC 2432) TaxID=447093 RepID=C0NA98_AJECG|nr:uncharacterized protein HCBG_00044 [Histoplasma capsulatum G186AR]EEH10589.1 predicted protein [Histoplasma capsulatum G186AR]